MDLIPEDLRARAAERLVADIARHDCHLTTGFVGVGLLCPVLTAAGHADVAHRLLLTDTFPSWGYSIRHGATTIWERWDGWTEDARLPDRAHELVQPLLARVGRAVAVRGRRGDPPGRPGLRPRPHRARPRPGAALRPRHVRLRPRPDRERLGARCGRVVRARRGDPGERHRDRRAAARPGRADARAACRSARPRASAAPSATARRGGSRSARGATRSPWGRDMHATMPRDSLLADERRRLIARRLRQDGSVSVAALEAEFEVSAMTARRDLVALERARRRPSDARRRGPARPRQPRGLVPAAPRGRGRGEGAPRRRRARARRAGAGAVRRQLDDGVLRRAPDRPPERALHADHERGRRSSRSSPRSTRRTSRWSGSAARCASARARSSARRPSAGWRRTSRTSRCSRCAASPPTAT